MLKILIADDEEKICQLICHLIDWDQLGMEIVGVAHNGIEALEMIEKYHPDIAVTDIRMPGYDGLEMIARAKEINSQMEFIIISGYRHFEYAQSAIRYGVSDYLLKPIKKDELTATLSRMKDSYLQKTEQLTFEENVRLALKNDAGKLRTGFFSSILYPKEQGEVDMERVNREYRYTFLPGCFSIVSIKLDGIGEVYSSSLKFLAEKVSQLMETYVRPCCYDFEIYFENSQSYCLLNYNLDHKKQLRKQLKQVLDELLVQESIFRGLQVTIGMGKAWDSLEGMKASKKTADWAIEQRLVAGTNRMIEGGEICSTDFANSPQFHDFNQAMNQALERLDRDGVLLAMVQLKTNLVSRPGITGHEILQMTKEVCNLYLFYMRNNKLPVSDGTNFLTGFNQQAGEAFHVDQLFELLIKRVLQSLEAVLEEKKAEDNRPIRLAKQYIKAHYMQAITLEEVSCAAGFNPTYFSSLFKKETGSTFLEYLSETRMNRAKELLKESDESVASICEQVGYNDIKHFTKSFAKHTGLKPGEYRKLYS